MISAVAESISRGDARSVGFEAFGVRVAVTAPDGAIFDQLGTILPPVRRPCPDESAEVAFALEGRDDAVGVVKQGELLADDLPLAAAMEVLERELRTEVALRAPDVIFVHAGVVADGDRGLVLPGASFAGKTTLVAELVRAGAAYFSDEYAVLDREGRVHPYPRPLAIRTKGVARQHDAAALGGMVGEHAVPVAAVIVTTYRDGASWSPELLSHGEAVLALLANTVPAQSRPAESLHAATRAVEGAVLLQSERGDASGIAALMLDALRRA